MNSNAGSGAIRMVLYVAGDAPNSLRARVNLAAFCETHLDGRHELEIVDVFEEPKRALADRILLTPQLLVAGRPGRGVFVGDLSDSAGLLQALGNEKPRV